MRTVAAPEDRPTATRRAFLQRSAAIGASAFLACGTTPRVVKPIPRVGIMSLLLPSTSGLSESFVAELAELGYVRGRNIEIEGRWNDDPDPEARGARAFAELLAFGVDVIVAFGNVAQRSAKALTTRIPIVIVGGSDPIEAGLVSDLVRPGGNLTGITGDQSAIAGKRVQLLKEAFPHVTRVAIISDLDPERRRLRRAAEDAARFLGLEIITVEARTGADMPTALAAAADLFPDALLSFTLATSFTSHERAFAAARGIPGMYTSEAAVDNGSLMTYVEDGHDLMRRAAAYVVRILNGANPGEIPIERPTKFVFVINMKTARAQGLSIPPSVLARATRIIE